jgi:APA family basic amino acid/polyamine antiporter
MAGVIMVSTFGCLNGIILTGSRVYYAMAKDNAFFKPAAKLNKNDVPSNSLIMQCIWACILTLTGSYSDLLDYVVFAVLLFYIIAIAGIIVHRRKDPNLIRPYKVMFYPYLPILYCVLAGTVCVSLLIYKTAYAGMGLAIVLTGIPIYFLFIKRRKREVIID